MKVIKHRKKSKPKEPDNLEHIDVTRYRWIFKKMHVLFKIKTKDMARMLRVSVTTVQRMINREYVTLYEMQYFYPIMKVYIKSLFKIDGDLLDILENFKLEKEYEQETE